MSAALAIAASAAVASTAYSIYNGEKNAKMQKQALQQQQLAQAEAKQATQKQAALQEQEINRANAKQPDSQAVLAKATQDAHGGGGGTMLTGPMGVDPNLLSLGKNTLLGG